MSLAVLVVDDSIVFRTALSEVLNDIPEVEVVGTAPNGKIAMRRVESLQPDLVTLDMEMPEMDGIAFLENISLATHNMGVIVLSGHGRHDSDLTVRALELGAFDFLEKPQASSGPKAREELRQAITPLVNAFRRVHKPKKVKRPVLRKKRAPEPPPVWPAVEFGCSQIVAIGVSTGGPNALSHVLPQLPEDFPVPLVGVQHMPPLFTSSLASNLNNKCAITVKEGEHMEPILPGTLYLAPGGMQMKLVRNDEGETFVQLTDDAPENNCKPAVDYLFRSVSQLYPGTATSIILTGMGTDGTLGVKLMKRAGAYSIAQDEATSTVWGMPRSVTEAGAVDVVLPLHAIAAKIMESVARPIYLLP